MRPILMKGHERPLTFLKYSRDGDLLFSCAKDHNPTVWFADNGERLGTYRGHNGAVWSCDISRDSTRLITGSADQTAKIWDVKTGTPLYTFNFDSPARSVDFAVGDKLAAITTDPFMGLPSAIHIKHIARDPEDQIGESVLILKGPRGRINRAVWGPLNRTLISAGEDSVIRIWDSETGKLLKESDKEDGHKILLHQFQNPRMVLSFSLLWDIRRLELIKTYVTERPVNAVAMSPLLDHVVLGGGQDASAVTTTDHRAGKFEAKFYDMILAEEIGGVKGHFGPINALAFNPHGKRRDLRKMSLRHQVLVDFPDPKYEKYGKEPFITIILYHGGSIIRSPKPEYVGGIKSKFDFVDVFNITVDYLNKLGEKLGYMGPKQFYRLHLNCFIQLNYQTEIVKFTEAYSPQNRIFTLYLECVECPNTQSGSSNPNVEPKMDYVHCPNTQPDSLNPDVEPQMQTNIQKGKGVAVDDGNDHDLDEVEWDEVCKIVDSYAEGNGSGDVDDDDGVSDEGDGLFDSELEGDDGEGDDSETDSNVDDCGGEDSGQEEVESSDSEDTTSDDDIRQYNPEHKCARSFNVKNVNSKWLSIKYEDAFRTDPKRNVKGFRKDIIKELRCHVSRNQAYRAKKKALEAIEGKAEDQFDSLWDYASELRNSNPGSIVMMVMTDGDDGTEQRKFSKFFVCFDALRQGFLSGCRPVIGVDGCHLKGPYGGVLLTAVSIDLNNNLYPLAYAVVSGETREAWQWFLELLKDDLHVVRDDVYTFISDKQKGLILAFEYVFPGADNRFCVRHLHGNMKTAGFRGLALKKGLWNAAKATTLDDCHYEVACYDGASQSLEPEDFVNPCYSVATFIEVYKYAILHVNGPNLWEKTGFVPPLPPNFGRGAGRPARARRLEHDEPQNKGKKRTRGQKNQTIKLKRQPYKVMCHYCGETDHNKKGCARKKMDHPAEPSVAEQPRKMTARKKTSTTKQPTVIAEKAPQKSTRKSMQQVQRKSTRNPCSKKNPDASQQMLHNFTQCSTVNQSSANVVPCLTKGGKKFITMTNLSAAVAATKKKKKIDKETK
ncbi:Eukaryotic translation initiation factor 3 subunit I [Sesamum angolense]|uniref:Serine-threonine kinase receptor-associated protein n=1 Tax=Sesamum angolense TaxID=2727404 RepID=A0AAE1X8J6_9LAMI|nr:Eukaryotic translation initiation factor 3 subunit I [Sesamum angolense]